MKPMLAQLVINERSRRGSELADTVRAALRAHDIAFYESESPEDIDADTNCVIAAGGDGTIISQVANALARGLPLGVIPVGTFNDLARTLGIPLDVDAACAVIAARHERAIDVGEVNGRYFVNEASIGISSRISRLQTSEVKQRFGALAIIATALQAFRYSRAIRAEVRYDGRVERCKTIQMTVANSNRFGGVLHVEDASIDDGWLDLYSVDIESFREAFSLARAIFAGRRESAPGIRMLRSTWFDIRTRRPHRIAADGEPAGMTPAVFRVLHKALRVIVPPNGQV
jgi:diacylglycerol kinase (ATP)